jgi:hypothetical protein
LEGLPVSLSGLFDTSPRSLSHAADTSSHPAQGRFGSGIKAVRAGLFGLASAGAARFRSPVGAEPPDPCLDPYQIALAGLGSPLLSYGEWW